MSAWRWCKPSECSHMSTAQRLHCVITQAMALQISHEIGTLRGALKSGIWGRVCKIFKRQKKHKASILIIAILISRVGLFCLEL